MLLNFNILLYLPVCHWCKVTLVSISLSDWVEVIGNKGNLTYRRVNALPCWVRVLLLHKYFSNLFPFSHLKLSFPRPLQEFGTSL